MKLNGESYCWNGKKVFITGVTGFMGSWLAKDLIEKRAIVVGLLQDKIPQTNLHLMNLENKVVSAYGSVSDYELLKRIINEFEIEVCFHLAAQPIVDVARQSPLATFKTNIEGTINLLEACREGFSVKAVVVASSDKAYGEHKDLPYTEEHALCGLSPYDASKSCADIMARTYFHTYHLPVAVARCANIYGGGDLNFSRIVPGTLLSVLSNEAPIIRSDGTPVRDYLYIIDAVKAYLCLAEKMLDTKIHGEAFNFGALCPISVLDLVRKIIDISGNKTVNPKILGAGKRYLEISRQYLSSEKALKMLGWQAEYSLDEGLQETVNWYKTYLKEPIRKRANYRVL